MSRFRTSGIIRSSTAKQHTGGQATESQPTDLNQGFWARISDLRTASDGVDLVPYAQFTEVHPEIQADGTLSWEYRYDEDGEPIGRRSTIGYDATTFQPYHENILVLDQWHNSTPAGIKSVWPDLGTILWLEKFGYWDYKDAPDREPTPCYSAQITDLVWLELKETLTPEIARAEAYVLWRDINTALEQFTPDHEAELIRTPALVYVVDPLHDSVIIGANDSQTTDPKGEFILARYCPAAAGWEPVRMGMPITRIMYGEDHPGYGIPFKGYLGQWCPQSSAWVYDCSQGCDEWVWCIDFFYGGSTFSYPEAGATGLFVPRESWQYGVIWTALSGDCASLGACDAFDRAGPCPGEQVDHPYSGDCAP